nr:MAG TPA: cobalamin biosynthesis protein [Caudoviricetes sp.]
MPNVNILKASIEPIANMLAGKKIKVSYDRDNTTPHLSFGDEKRGMTLHLPMLSDKTPPKIMEAIQGVVDHEVGHAIFSTNPKTLGLRDKLSQHIANNVEDVRIEREMRSLFKGSAHNLQTMAQAIIDGEFLLKLEMTREMKPHLFTLVALNVALQATEGVTYYQELVEKIPGFKEIYDALVKNFGVRPMNAVRSTQDAADFGEQLRTTFKIKWEKDPPENGGSEEDGDGESDEEQDQEDSSSGSSSSNSEGGGKSKKSKKQRKEKGSNKSKGKKGGGDSSDSDSDSSAGDSDGSDQPEGTGEGAGQDNQESGTNGGDKNSEKMDEDKGDESKGKDGSSEDNEKDGDKDQEGNDEGDDENKSESGEGGESESENDSEDEKNDPSEEGGDSEKEFSGKESGDDGEEGDDEDDDDVDGEPQLPAIGDGSKPGEPLKPEDLDELSDMMKKVIGKLVSEAQANDTYTVKTTDYDKIEHIKPSSRKGKVEELNTKVKTMTSTIQKNLERAIAARSIVCWTPGHRRGKLFAPALMKLFTGDDRVFRRREEAMSKDVAVSLVVDCSGSMAGDGKAPLAATAAYALCEVLTRMGIKNEVIGFTTRYEGRNELGSYYCDKYSRQEPIYMPIFKGFADKFDMMARLRMVKMFEDHWMSDNVDGECVQIAAQRLLAQNTKGKIMIVLSDGYPAAFGNCNDLEKNLKETVQELSHKIKIVGIGIRSKAVKDYYPKYVVLNNIKELPGTVVRKLQELLLFS